MKVINLEGNEIIGTPITNDKCVIQFKGTGAKVVIGENVRLANFKLIFSESGGTVILGDGCKLTGDLRVIGKSTLKIGARTKFNKPCWILASDGTSVTIGERCLFANVRIRTSDMHSIVDLTTNSRINPDAGIEVGNRVWLAENVYIYKGVSIGDGSIVGAGSIVTRSVPENSLAAGIPAKVLKSNVSWNEKRL
ncbi:acyltransferase [Pseudomonas cremoricolorata]|uniref:acyltransferase n=1 Tax=Pseudomonas cremoricolorata TaxID=157783 RepID=UPI00067EA221|nr:acyltransferase [Pseudomonas cremoricolorata]